MTPLERTGLRRGFLDGGGRLIGKRLETRRILHRELGQHLAVDLDPGLVEAVDKSAVGQPVLARGRVDALDPERAERALLTLAVAVLILQRLLDRLLATRIVFLRRP
jgi:hypothetical protein